MNLESSRFARWMTAAVVALSTAGCASDDFADDISFDRWCGDELCDWRVDEGRIEKVGTWHRSDFGVGLAARGTQISQFQELQGVDCMRFDLIADVTEASRTTLQLDFNDDGTIDFSQTLAAGSWDATHFLVRTPERYHGVRFILHKAGPGRVVLAQMGVARPEAGECHGPRLQLEPQGAGSACRLDRECSEGTCVGETCRVCEGEGDGGCESD